MKPTCMTIIASAGLAALVASGTANAAQDPSEPSQKEEAIGVFSGMAIGAIAGGPFGAIAGMTVGALLGHRFDAKKHEIATLDKRLWSEPGFEQSQTPVTRASATLGGSSPAGFGPEAERRPRALRRRRAPRRWS